MDRRGASLSTTLRNDLSVDEYGMERALALVEINSAPDGLSVCRRFKKSNASFKVSNSTHRNFSYPIGFGLNFHQPHAISPAWVRWSFTCCIARIERVEENVRR
jgi:hypothetical protein